jgi:hypothetical protein
MLRRSLSLLLLAGAVGLSWRDVSTCGDKFLLVGRLARFQRSYCALHPASILIYVNPKSHRATAMSDPEFLGALKLAGHKPETVTQQSKFADLFVSGRYDLVLAEFSDAPDLARQLEMATAKPLLLPIMYKANKTDLAAAAQQYGAVLSAPDRITHFLGVIDDVMKARQAAIRAANSE